MARVVAVIDYVHRSHGEHGFELLYSSAKPRVCSQCGEAYTKRDSDAPSKAEASFLAALKQPSKFATWARAVRKNWTEKRGAVTPEAGAGPALRTSNRDSDRARAAQPKRNQ